MGTRRSRIAGDGKAQRGRRQFEEQANPVQLLSAFYCDQNLVLPDVSIEHEATMTRQN